MKHRIFTSIFILLSLLILAQRSVQAQTSDGRDFYLGYVEPSFNRQQMSVVGQVALRSFAVYALISSSQATKVTVGYFDNSGNEISKKEYSVAANLSIQVPLDYKHMEPDSSGEVAEYKTCHITSNHDITITYYSYGALSGGAYLSLPTPMLGTQYSVIAYHDNPNGYGNGGLSHENGRGFRQIIAAYDSTFVTITPSTTTFRGDTGVISGIGSNGVTKHPFSVMLRRGQCYTVFSSGTNKSNDIGGTSIVATKPIGVLGGNENAFVDGIAPSRENVDSRDFMIDQLFPVTLFDSIGYNSIPIIYGTGTLNSNFDAAYELVGGNDASTVSITKLTDSNASSLQLAPYSIRQDSVATQPVSFHSTNNKVFGAMQCEHRFTNDRYWGLRV